MTWLKNIIGTEKAVIAMCHLRSMPGDPHYDAEKGMKYVVDCAKHDMLALQDGGVDAIMFSNEFSLPYVTDVPKVTIASMAYIIGELKPLIKIPFGVNALWDGQASIDLAVATGASFVREIFTGVYASDFGLWNTNFGQVSRHQKLVDGQNVKLLFNIFPEAAKYLAERDICETAKSTVFNCGADALCVSGLTAGVPSDSSIITKVKSVVPNTVIFANTGCKKNTIVNTLKIADGAVVGTAFKIDGKFENLVDENNVKEFMDVVKNYRKTL